MWRRGGEGSGSRALLWEPSELLCVSPSLPCFSYSFIHSLDHSSLIHSFTCPSILPSAPQHSLNTHAVRPQAGPSITEAANAPAVHGVLSVQGPGDLRVGPWSQADPGSSPSLSSFHHATPRSSLTILPPRCHWIPLAIPWGRGTSSGPLRLTAFPVSVLLTGLSLPTLLLVWPAALLLQSPQALSLSKVPSGSPLLAE